MRLGLFLTCECNQNCAYCFKKNTPDTFISQENFDFFCKWACRAKASEIYFAGGEPTLHPNFAEYVQRVRRESRTHVCVISNLLCEEEKLEGFNHCGVLVNASPPHTVEERALFSENLAKLMAAPGTRVTLSHTLYKAEQEDSHIVPLSRDLGISHVRFDFARASLLRDNCFVTLEGAKTLKDKFLSIARPLHELGILVRLDCGIPEGIFSPEELASVGLGGIALCHPEHMMCSSVYINPDLTISSCPFGVVGDYRLDMFQDLMMLTMTVGFAVKKKAEMEGKPGAFLCMAERFLTP